MAPNPCGLLCVISSVCIRRGCRCSGMLRSILSSAIASPTFLRESPLTNIVSSSAAVGRRGLIDANSSPEVHSNQRIVLRLIVMQFAASTVPCELDFPGGISHHRCGDGDRTTGRISAHRLLDHEDGSGLIHAARAAWARHSEDTCDKGGSRSYWCCHDDVESVCTTRAAGHPSAGPGVSPELTTSGPCCCRLW